jgi:co-chaperonin GroES (HSP10)
MDALKGEVGQVDVIVTPSTQIVDGNGQVIETEEPKPTATQLPTPTGYKLLIALPQPDKATEGGILKAKETLNMEEVGSIVGFVISMGPDCYMDGKRFPNGPYCKQGDFVLMRAYSGTRFKIHGEEFRLINDDSVEAVVDDPRGISKL